METLRQVRTYKNEINLIRGFIYFLAICLIILSIWKYATLEQEFLVFIMNLSSALIFIILIEWSKQNQTRAFGYGVFLSIVVFLIYVYAFGEKFNPFTLDTLIFIIIDATIRMGDKINDKLKVLNEIVAKTLKPNNNENTVNRTR